ncbi:MAG: glycosyltransferase [Calditrichia bacterium]
MVQSNNHKPKKILEISSYPPPRAGWGVRVSYIKEALLAGGHVCEVLNTSPFSRKIPSDDYLTTMSGLDYVKKVMTRCLKGYRVHMHMNGDSPKGFVLTCLALTISLLTFKRPYITFHAGPYQKYFPQERAPLLTPVYKYIFSVCKKVICNNEAVKDKIAGYGIRREKIITIQAFSVQYLKYHPISLNGKLNRFMSEKRPLITTYGFFRPEFFFDRMVRSIAKTVKKYPNLGLIFIALEDDSEEVKKIISETGITDNVLFAGDQDHDSFLTILSQSDIYLRTPVKDGVCSSVLEALSLGVPVVASENHRRPECVITYDHEDIDDLPRVLDQVFSNIETIRSQVVKPEIRDTVADEISILIE